MGRWILISLAAFLHFIVVANSIAVMSVDLGGEWIKVGIVSVRPIYIIHKKSITKQYFIVAWNSYGDSSQQGVQEENSSCDRLPQWRTAVW